jgi:5-methylcytosine-specific restriction endonuclease McrA
MAKGIIKEGVEVHHKIPIEKDWSKRLDYNNLILLCKECHQSEHERSGNLNEFLKIWDKGE